MVNFSVLNELSLPFSSDINIVKKFIEFFQLMEEMSSKGLTSLRLSPDFKNSEILENIKFQQFIGQQKDQDFKRKIISFLTNKGVVFIDSPIIKKTESKEQDLINCREYFYNTETTDGGLACSDIWNTIAVSFDSHPQWNTDAIILQRDALSDDELIQQDIQIKHASKLQHLEAHYQFFNNLSEEIKLAISKETFWEQKKDFFPQLIIFCPEVKAQINKLDKIVFQQAISILRDIETQQKLIIDFNHSGESATVHQNPELRKLREFTIDGNKVFFEQHLKSLPNAYRIYYLERGKNIYIGYIGKHLKGKKDK